MNLSTSKLPNALFRGLYCAAMYTGARALFNRTWRRGGEPDARLDQLGAVQIGGRGPLEAKVHMRTHPAGCDDATRHGMISLWLHQPRVPRWLYRALRLTSHFGCGHVEVAFFVRDRAVTIYAVRNVASGNARRLRLHRTADRLRLHRSGEARRVLRAVARQLRARGFGVSHAPAEQCVALSVDDRLLAEARRPAARAHLRRRYQRLHAQFAADSPVPV